ncbi:hypothetical protein ACH5RR_032411 [Cinchona calisaya]|uniref:Uncharacterized protein n=1 Tax=Cinchona calisaya TaxID=153742 RepID=A0ABD2YHZ5_9GENT
MEISWREGLVSRIFDTDELDYCRCLSDEEKCGDRSDEFPHKSPKAFQMEECDLFRNGDLKSPEFLEHEPEVLGKGNKALSPVGTNICAESISTDAGRLVASEDSIGHLATKTNCLMFEW